jgi:hypothetical protein
LEKENKLLNEKIEKQINELKNEKKLLNEKIEVQNKENNNLKNENKLLNEKIEKQANKLKNEKKILNETIEVQSEEINNLKNENKLLNEKIEEQKKECKYPKIITDIMKSNEKFLIFSEIEKRMNKKIKQIKKLYQATIDGGDSINFHKKCDNISNTLILIKSEGKRRFGGFTPIAWKSEDDFKLIKDPENKTFIFSLDNKKIYSLKAKDSTAVTHYIYDGPCFGYKDINIWGNPIKTDGLYTIQDDFDYKGDIKALSEFVYQNIKINEYEVFHVKFYKK